MPPHTPTQPPVSEGFGDPLQRHVPQAGTHLRERASPGLAPLPQVGTDTALLPPPSTALPTRF